MEENNENSSESNIQNDNSNSSPQNAGDVFHPEVSEPTDSISSNQGSAATPETSGDSTEENSTAKSSTSTPDTSKPEPNPELLSISTTQPVKKKSKKGLMFIVVILVLGLAGAAAWWFTQKKDNKGNTSQSKVVIETQDIEVLRIGTAQGPASVYFPDEGILGIQISMDHQIYEGLVGFEKDTIKPRIAQSWTNPDQKTWVFKIQPKVKFHTGKPVTAKEVKAALDDLKKYDYWSLFVSTIETVEATGELELTIKTKEPDALLLNRLAQAYISDLTAPEALGNNGTGPYQEDTTAKNDEKTTTLVAFDDYYGGEVKSRKLVFMVYETDEAIAKAYKEKQIDLAETIPIPSVVKELEGSEYTSTEYQAQGAFGLYLNQTRTTSAVLKNKDIRLAVAQAMDRQTLIDKVGNKNAPATQVIPKSLPGYDASISFPTFDVAAAKASLAKAGYKNTPLEFLYIKELQQDAPILIEQLRAVGFNIKEKTFDGDSTDEAVEELKAGKFDLFAAGYTSDVGDARDILGGILGSAESTYPTYSDASYDKLLADSDKEFDPTKRIALLQQANKYIADNLAWVPLRNSTYVVYHPKDIDITIDFNGGALGTYYYKVGRTVQ